MRAGSAFFVRHCFEDVSLVEDSADDPEQRRERRLGRVEAARLRTGAPRTSPFRARGSYGMEQPDFPDRISGPVGVSLRVFLCLHNGRFWGVITTSIRRAGTLFCAQPKGQKTHGTVCGCFSKDSYGNLWDFCV